MNGLSKQTELQRFIFKIHSTRLRKSRWNLTLSLKEARANEEIISLSSSQVLRWIDEINGEKDAELRAIKIKKQIKELKREPNNVKTKNEIRHLYTQLDNTLFKPDYMCLIIDKEKDYYRACNGFSINGVEYERYVGTNGGIKNSTIVFVSKRIATELKRRMENDRDVSKPIVPAKLEAYRALACSASIPVSTPNGVLVVNSCELTFKDDIVHLSDSLPGEPTMRFEKDADVTLDVTDGFGLMTPSLAERWSKELGLDYRMAGCNTRFPFEKGVVFTFDFRDFAELVAGTYKVHDVWGEEVDIRNVELILTTSMVKLWSSYKSCEDYMSKSLSNGYTFAVTKTCPKTLESRRNLNYQYIQSYDLDDSQIYNLISPTIDEISDVLGGDWKKTLIFLKGNGLTKDNIKYAEDDIAKAIMINREMMNDPYVISHIYQTIKNRIDEAKVGSVSVHGNYSIASGDPYTLCQSIFGLEPTGLLGAGQIYSKYWADLDAGKLACYRSPMTTHSNIRLVESQCDFYTSFWYQYMNACTIFNSHDTCMAALNGMDYDGDLVMLTDNKVLVDNLVPMPALVCEQRNASKCIPTEQDVINANIGSFGNAIGQITNRATSMFEIMGAFPRDSEEYKTLLYRIQCCQLLQQNEIDKAKGIISKPMPKEWYDRHSVSNIEDDSKRELYRRIVADKKPYFMTYIYPTMMKQYNDYIKNTNTNSMREFGVSVSDLSKKDPDELTHNESEFLRFYNMLMPVGVGKCVMNDICREFERRFDGYVSKNKPTTEFDYTIMKSGNPYPISTYNTILRIYEDYSIRLKKYSIFSKSERINQADAKAEMDTMNEEFVRECSEKCPNEETLCDIVLDICYRKRGTKKFAWSMCGSQIIRNLLENSGRVISFPVMSEDGDIEYGGMKFKLIGTILNNEEEDECEYNS